jgi:hypothetical protein
MPVEVCWNMQEKSVHTLTGEGEGIDAVCNCMLRKAYIL